jgi:SHS2 domain-containing protein
MRKFEIIDTTADIGIRAFGSGWPELFANAALGMFTLITDPATIHARVEKAVSVDAPDRESLLVAWLNELVFLFDTEMLIFSRFEVLKFKDTHLEARCYGEKVDKSRHPLQKGIKSATYHKLKVEIKGGLCMAEVILDI